MMANLFSIFEPSSSIFNLSTNWLSTFLGLMFIPYLYWASPSRWSLFWSKIIQTLHKEFKALLTPYHSGVSILFIALFSLIVFNNSLGLLPYVFTSSSHMVMTLSLSLPLWITLMIFGWVNHTKHMFAHLVPQGTPFVLMPFMVLIETISNIIRPGTLAVRLAANMIAGHLLLTLLGSTGPSLPLSILSILIFSQILLLILESAVAIIQSYVFAVLSTLYTSEIN
uniref:ATP synthase subunit a n=1 Tax=Austinograea alayseae TaxID=1131899 RepID=M1ETX0_AUSAL|nr:ATP synthase F0 subunit 6 [Austinograea alayseae]AEX32646.1 ATP synthase F0 subunit 6 [Austinograea alayseae]AGJ50511.1 ATP synthase F0 subunit 6 [Austinograea alayseae]